MRSTRNNSRVVGSTRSRRYILAKAIGGLGIGFAPEWTLYLPNRNFELRKVQNISKNHPDIIIDIARSLVRAGSQGKEC